MFYRLFATIFESVFQWLVLNCRTPSDNAIVTATLTAAAATTKYFFTYIMTGACYRSSGEFSLILCGVTSLQKSIQTETQKIAILPCYSNKYFRIKTKINFDV